MKEFVVPYSIGLEMKKLGFDEVCLYHYKKMVSDAEHSETPTFESLNMFGRSHNHLDTRVAAPFWDQAFGWVRKTYDFHAHINIGDKGYYCMVTYPHNGSYKADFLHEYGEFFETYEKARIHCLYQILHLKSIKK